MIKRFLNMIFPPPKPEVSDVLSVTLVRRTENGGTVTCNLEGEQASKWGHYVMRSFCESHVSTRDKFSKLRWNKHWSN